MHGPAMSNRLKYLRSEEGSAMMFETREEEVRRKAEEARLEGILETQEENALRALRKGLSAEDVAEILSLAIEAVRDIARRNGIELP